MLLKEGGKVAGKGDEKAIWVREVDRGAVVLRK